MIVPVVLAGGYGSRLWPLSRTTYPKQLLPLVSGQTMLQDTLTRAKSISDSHFPLVICNDEHRFLVAEQIKEIDVANAQIILEPFGKNTAPATAIAALHLVNQHQDAIMLVLPADHYIKDTKAFLHAIQVAQSYSEQNYLVTFGVTPTHPETGYGYIKTGEKMNDNAHIVQQFVEKPNLETAKNYLFSGQHYYWNSGMFMFKASVYLAELEKHDPDMLNACKKVVNNFKADLDFIRINKDQFANCPSNSIDYAIMEKTKKAILVPLNAIWNDVGSWSALWEVHNSDPDGNVTYGDVITDGVSNSYLRAESRMLAVVGVDNHVVIETADAVLVAHKDNCQAVKEMVSRLKEKKRTETDLHKRVFRPWGHYETIDKAENFQVKRITVKPKSSLSLQMHYHRSEHWIVVKGVATVTCGNDIFTIKANESTYIPLGTKHRLANLTDESLEIIEVQSGHYLGEDDIVRFEDVYGREVAV